MMPRLLIIEDDPAFARRLARNLAMDGFETDIAEGGDEGLRRLSSEVFDAALCDVKMPGLDGFALLRSVRAGTAGVDPRFPFVVLTSMNNVETAVEAMRAGADDYLTKESSRQEIALRLRRAMEQRHLATENERLKEKLALTGDFGEMAGESDALMRIRQDIAEVGPTDATVLIFGETGVGKELVARAIHHSSGRTGEFVDVNSALLPDDSMLQSELFGHEKGAFTDAKAVRRGKLEIAEGGTLFLDEVGELPRDTQAKMLRVLETMTFTRLGGTRPIKVNVRLIAATNRDLTKEMEEGRFREDLYYRLNVFPIVVPPLRERPEDIPPLVAHFLARFADRYHKRTPELSPEAAAALRRYRFPGNVRELRNICERLVIRTRSVLISAEAVRECGIAPESGAPRAVEIPPDGLRLDDLERDLVVEALRRCQWNQTEAAALLGISVDRMNNRVKKYGLTHDRWRVHRATGEVE